MAQYGCLQFHVLHDGCFRACIVVLYDSLVLTGHGIVMLTGGWLQRLNQARGFCNSSHRESVPVSGQGRQVSGRQRHQGCPKRRRAHGEIWKPVLALNFVDDSCICCWVVQPALAALHYCMPCNGHAVRSCVSMPCCFCGDQQSIS